jgi:glycerophosphoryl diester phosphodiesterase
VWLYQVPKCTGHGEDRRVIHPQIAAYGIRVGAKYLGGCDATPVQLADAGYAFVIGAAGLLTRSWVDDAHHYGLEVGNYDSGQHAVWRTLIDAGADYLLVPRPAKFDAWRTRR